MSAKGIYSVPDLDCEVVKVLLQKVVAAQQDIQAVQKALQDRTAALDKVSTNYVQYMARLAAPFGISEADAQGYWVNINTKQLELLPDGVLPSTRVAVKAPDAVEPPAPFKDQVVDETAK